MEQEVGPGITSTNLIPLVTIETRFKMEKFRAQELQAKLGTMHKINRQISCHKFLAKSTKVYFQTLKKPKQHVT